MKAPNLSHPSHLVSMLFSSENPDSLMYKGVMIENQVDSTLELLNGSVNLQTYIVGLVPNKRIVMLDFMRPDKVRSFFINGQSAGKYELDGYDYLSYILKQAGIELSRGDFFKLLSPKRFSF